MKFSLLILISLTFFDFMSPGQEKVKLTKTDVENVVITPTSKGKEKGVVKNNVYICSIYDWSISIPKESIVYYPKTDKKKSSKLPEVIKNQINENLLVIFGVDENNYFSAYIESTTELKNNGSGLNEISENSINNFRDTSRNLCAKFEARYSNNREVAFKQYWKNELISGVNYDIYEIRLVLYPEEAPIVNQVVYVRKERDNTIYFTVTYTNENDKEVLMQNLVESLQ
ncbi:hypothetical protein LZ575_20260 [Antarcticibacterium sp. 1MA-6-2]|uniref:hypothetical protein n=1 Tax=Antarcticibacterium sp. 1MA-6-2 TaxID=2908210 RepID=UPI001F252CD8|nr:hypothetical protein [Antarcticibacterium sp. 1MA-6-2]UJH90983.1 hypothetical protein LZ575_20260 [Antarcticibacterium sp. 1MA-6-2]